MIARTWPLKISLIAGQFVVETPKSRVVVAMKDCKWCLAPARSVANGSLFVDPHSIVVVVDMGNRREVICGTTPLVRKMWETVCTMVIGDAHLRPAGQELRDVAQNVVGAAFGGGLLGAAIGLLLQYLAAWGSVVHLTTILGAAVACVASVEVHLSRQEHTDLLSRLRFLAGPALLCAGAGLEFARSNRMTGVAKIALILFCAFLPVAIAIVQMRVMRRR